jgi:hypothetical protein
VLALLPITARTRLEELVASLQKLLGGELVSVIVHGSAVRGGYSVAESDVDLVVVLDDDAPEKLERIGPALRIARAAARIECLILDTEEIPQAADVFPLLYDDIRACHAVLHGIDPFADLHIEDQHRRLRIEQELRDARIRLRRVVASEGLAGPTLAGPLARRIKQVRSPLHALLALVGRDVKDDLAAVLTASADRWRADAAALLSPQRDPNAALRSLRTVLDGAVAEVDKLEVAR